MLALFAAATGTGCEDIADAKGNTTKFCTNLPTAGATTDNIQNIVHIVGGTFAAIAVLIIVIAAFNIVLADGDSSKVAKARSTILYAFVGLAVTISATAIVSLVLDRL